MHLLSLYCFTLFLSLSFLKENKCQKYLIRKLDAEKDPISFYTTSFGQLSYIYSDNKEASQIISTFYTKFKLLRKREKESIIELTDKENYDNLSIESSAKIGNTTAEVASSNQVSTKKSFIISGVKGQFVKNPMQSEADSMRVYNIGEIMLEGVIAFVEIQASLTRNNDFYLDVKINEQSKGLIKNSNGDFMDSKTINRKVIMFDSKVAFGVSEIYFISLNSKSVDFKIYTIASASSIFEGQIMSSVIIEISHISIGENMNMIVEQATLTSTSQCNFEDKCKVVNIGSIKVNGDLLSKLVQAQSIAGADFEKKQAVVGQMYGVTESTITN